MKTPNNSVPNNLSTEQQVEVSIDDLAKRTLTDILIKVCRKTLEQNRHLIDKDKGLRSLTITVKLSEKQLPYRIFLTPTHEYDI